MTDAVPDGPRNVLLVGSDGPVTDEVCVDLLSETEPEATNVLSVTFDRDADDLVGDYRSRHGQLPAKTGVIEVGGQTRSSAGSSPTGPGSAPVTIDAVSDPSNLNRLSMAISAYLDAWAAVDETPVICLHSLSSWLGQTDEARVFEFLHAIVGRLKEIDAKAHVHIDPDVHEVGTVNRFAALMDAVVRVEDDGSTTVQTRN